MSRRPGISTDTFPSINAVVKSRKHFDAASAKLANSPAAEHVAAIAVSSAYTIAHAMDVIDSLGLEALDIVQLLAKTDGHDSFAKAVFDLITKKD